MKKSNCFHQNSPTNLKEKFSMKSINHGQSMAVKDSKGHTHKRKVINNNSPPLKHDEKHLEP